MSEEKPSTEETQEEPTPGKKFPRLNHAQRTFILRELAQFVRIKDVINDTLKEFQHEWELGGKGDEELKGWAKWLRQRLDYYAYVSKPGRQKVQDFRKAWLDGMGKDQALWHKATRLKELSRIYEDAMEEKLVKVYTKIVKEEADGTKHYRVFKIYSRDRGAAIAVLRAIAEEKGDLPPRGEGLHLHFGEQTNIDMRQQAAVFGSGEMDEWTKRNLAVGTLRALGAGGRQLAGDQAGSTQEYPA